MTAQDRSKGSAATAVEPLPQVPRYIDPGEALGTPITAATTNACTLCAPLGASVAFKGLEGCVPLLHGSQGCSTYVRRYLISHYKEPVDVASSNFSEDTAVFGGGPNLAASIRNVASKYRPGVIGVASTCLSETIGDDVPFMVREWEAGEGSAPGAPLIVHCSTPAYAGTHVDGFHAAVRAMADTFAEGGDLLDQINLVPGFVSPADLRYLKGLLEDFGLGYVLLPDYSMTLDGPALAEYERIPAGGTTVDAVRSMGRSKATLELGATLALASDAAIASGQAPGAAMVLERRFGTPRVSLGLPMGVRETDRLVAELERLSGRALPAAHELERGRLVDSYVDGHKHLSGARAVVTADEDLAVGLVALLSEVGVTPVLVASGGRSSRLAEAVAAAAAAAGLDAGDIEVREDTDFAMVADRAAELAPDFVIGSSKAYRICRELGVPLVRAGFPVHDRLDGARMLHLGYRGAQQLLDRITDMLIAAKQDASPMGYAYM